MILRPYCGTTLTRKSEDGAKLYFEVTFSSQYFLYSPLSSLITPSPRRGKQEVEGVPLDSENSQIQTLDSRESYKRKFIRSEINTTTYLQTEDLSGQLKENKGNK